MAEETVKVNVGNEEVEETPEAKTEREEKEKKDIQENLTPEEIEMAKAQGLLPKESEKKEETLEEKTAREEKEKKAEEDKKNKDGKKIDGEVKKVGNEPTQEELKKFTRNEKALYWKQKNERIKRQQIENEKTQIQVRLNVLKQKYPEVYSEITGEIDTAIDKDKTFTAEEVETREKAQKEKDANEQTANIETAKLLKEKNIIEEQDAKEKYPDFDNVMVLAEKVLQEQLGKSAKVGRLYKAMMEAAISTDLSDETAADIAYEIGKLHPDYKPENVQSDDKKSEKKDEKQEIVDKAKINKMIENAGKKVSSAAVGEGSKDNLVSEDDLTLEQAARLTGKEFAKLSPRTIKRLQMG